MLKNMAVIHIGKLISCLVIESHNKFRTVVHSPNRTRSLITRMSIDCGLMPMDISVLCWKPLKTPVRLVFLMNKSKRRTGLIECLMSMDTTMRLQSIIVAG